MDRREAVSEVAVGVLEIAGSGGASVRCCGGPVGGCPPADAATGVAGARAGAIPHRSQ
jgi:hypothetical protein